jgi:integrase
MTEKRIHVWIQPCQDRPFPRLQWIDPDTGQRKSQSVGTANPKALETARADLEADLNHGRHKAASRLSWQRFRELFTTEYAAATRPDTQRNFAITFDAFEHHCHPTSLKSITERTLSTFVAALRRQQGRKAKTMAPTTIRVHLQFLHSALSWAVRQKMIPTVPAFPVVKVPKVDPKPIPTEAFEKLVDKADPQMQTFLLCGWLAGLRLGEALALEWEETDSAPYLDMNRNRIWLPGGFVKGGKDQWIPLDPELKTALQALPRHGAKVFHFQSQRGGLLTKKGMSTTIHKLAHQAGVRLGMHSLRKGFGCRYAAKVPAQVLQKLMRHSNIRITMDYYANVDAAVEEAVLGPQISKILRSGVGDTPPPDAYSPARRNSAPPRGKATFQNQPVHNGEKTAQDASGELEAADPPPEPSGAVLDAQNRSGPGHLNKRVGVKGSRIAANRTEGGAKASAVAEAVNGLPNAAQDPGAAILGEGRPCGRQSTNLAAAHGITRRDARGRRTTFRTTPPAAALGHGAENDVTPT